jgi:MFS family permease
MFFFISAATFMSLGVVLYSMIPSLRWTQTEAQSSYSILALGCCLSSLLPMAMVNRIGSRWTLFCGALILAAGFVLAFLTPALPVFLLATALMGIGFSLTANIPGVYLIAEWFPQKSGRIIGLYLMCGAFGGVAGPPAARAVIAAEGWRAYWLLLALIAAGLGLVCLLFIRDRTASLKEDPAPAAADRAGRLSPDWDYRRAVTTPHYAILALAMVLTETCVTVVHSTAVIHFSKLGLEPSFAALMLSLQALMATAAKGGSGALGDWVSPRLLLVAGLLLQALGMIVLGVAHTQALAYGFALAFGVGWGTCYLAVTVLLLDYFGPRTGSSVLSLVWLLTAFASLGPALAGMAADRFGTFAPVLQGSGLLLIPIAAAALFMRRPVEGPVGRSSRRARSARGAAALKTQI